MFDFLLFLLKHNCNCFPPFYFSYDHFQQKTLSAVRSRGPHLLHTAFGDTIHRGTRLINFLSVKRSVARPTASQFPWKATFCVNGAACNAHHPSKSVFELSDIIGTRQLNVIILCQRDYNETPTKLPSKLFNTFAALASFKAVR